jgi:predicted membrane-bound mannosyltransferase
MRLPALFNSPALQPTVLSDVTQRAVHEMLQEGESQNTQASYRGALRYWAAWFGMRYGLQITLPIATPAVLQFIMTTLSAPRPRAWPTSCRPLSTRPWWRPGSRVSPVRWPSIPWCTGSRS